MKRLMVFVPLESAHKKSGATALIAAILERAVDDIKAGDRLRTQALGWVCDLDAKERPGSFEWCCAALNLDVDVVRGRLVGQQGGGDVNDGRTATQRSPHLKPVTLPIRDLFPGD